MENKSTPPPSGADKPPAQPDVTQPLDRAGQRAAERDRRLAERLGQPVDQSGGALGVVGDAAPDADVRAALVHSNPEASATPPQTAAPDTIEDPAVTEARMRASGIPFPDDDLVKSPASNTGSTPQSAASPDSDPIDSSLPDEPPSSSTGGGSGAPPPSTSQGPIADGEGDDDTSSSGAQDSEQQAGQPAAEIGPKANSIGGISAEEIIEGGAEAGIGAQLHRLATGQQAEAIFTDVAGDDEADLLRIILEEHDNYVQGDVTLVSFEGGRAVYKIDIKPEIREQLASQAEGGAPVESRSGPLLGEEPDNSSGGAGEAEGEGGSAGAADRGEGTEAGVEAASEGGEEDEDEDATPEEDFDRLMELLHKEEDGDVLLFLDAEEVNRRLGTSSDAQTIEALAGPVSEGQLPIRAEWLLTIGEKLRGDVIAALPPDLREEAIRVLLATTDDLVDPASELDVDREGGVAERVVAEIAELRAKFPEETSDESEPQGSTAASVPSGEAGAALEQSPAEESKTDIDRSAERIREIIDGINDGVVRTQISLISEPGLFDHLALLAPLMASSENREDVQILSADLIDEIDIAPPEVRTALAERLVEEIGLLVRAEKGSPEKREFADIITKTAEFLDLEDMFPELKSQLTAIKGFVDGETGEPGGRGFTDKTLEGIVKAIGRRVKGEEVDARGEERKRLEAERKKGAGEGVTGMKEVIEGLDGGTLNGNELFKNAAILNSFIGLWGNDKKVTKIQHDVIEAIRQGTPELKLALAAYLGSELKLMMGGSVSDRVETASLICQTDRFLGLKKIFPELGAQIDEAGRIYKGSLTDRIPRLKKIFPELGGEAGPIIRNAEIFEQPALDYAYAEIEARIARGEKKPESKAEQAKRWAREKLDPRDKNVEKLKSELSQPGLDDNERGRLLGDLARTLVLGGVKPDQLEEYGKDAEGIPLQGLTRRFYEVLYERRGERKIRRLFKRWEEDSESFKSWVKERERISEEALVGRGPMIATVAAAPRRSKVELAKSILEGGKRRAASTYEGVRERTRVVPFNEQVERLKQRLDEPGLDTQERRQRLTSLAEILVSAQVTPEVFDRYNQGAEGSVQGLRGRFYEVLYERRNEPKISEFYKKWITASENFDFWVADRKSARERALADVRAPEDDSGAVAERPAELSDDERTHAVAVKNTKEDREKMEAKLAVRGNGEMAEEMGSDEVIEYFTNAIQRLGLTPRDVDRLLEIGGFRGGFDLQRKEIIEGAVNMLGQDKPGEDENVKRLRRIWTDDPEYKQIRLFEAARNEEIEAARLRDELDVPLQKIALAENIDQAAAAQLAEDLVTRTRNLIDRGDRVVIDSEAARIMADKNEVRGESAEYIMDQIYDAYDEGRTDDVHSLVKAAKYLGLARYVAMRTRLDKVLEAYKDDFQVELDERGS